MKSGFTFKKKEKNERAESSSYFGCPDLDRICDFQYPQCSMTLLLEGDKSRHSLCLARYFLGYGVHLKESVAVYDVSTTNWRYLFPKPMEKKKMAKMSEMKKENDKNKIAWRYNTQRLTFNKSELRSDYTVLDLSKNESIPTDQANDKKLILRSTMEADSLKDLYEFIEADCQNMLDTPQDSATKRFYISGLECFLQDSKQHEVLRFFMALKLLARCSHTTFVVAMDPKNLASAGQNCARMVESYFDYVLDFATIHNNKLLADFEGTLTFKKYASLDKFVQLPLDHYTYGVKNDKSTLDIELLYENSVAHTDERNEDNKLLCASGPAKDKLDF